MSITIPGWQPSAKDAINSGITQMAEVAMIGRNSMISGHTREKGIDCLAAYFTKTFGVLQKETNTIVGTAGASVNIPVTVVSALYAAANKTINVAVVNLDSASTVAGKIRTALGLDADISAAFTIGGTGADYSIEDKLAHANDTTLNISHGAITGIAADLVSTHTTAGVATSADPQELDLSAKFSRVDFITIVDIAGAVVNSVVISQSLVSPTNAGIILLTAAFTVSTIYIINVYGELKPGI